MTGTNWRDMFEDGRGGRAGPPPLPPTGVERDDGELPFDLSRYQPWLVQRGRSRPALMLNLRCYEARSGFWNGWQLSYPTLIAAEYVGDRLLSLDFGVRKFAIEGRALDELARHIQQGTVLAIQEYSASVWPERPGGPIVSAIRRLGMEGETPHGTSGQS